MQYLHFPFNNNDMHLFLMLSVKLMYSISVTFIYLIIRRYFLLHNTASILAQLINWKIYKKNYIK